MEVTGHPVDASLDGGERADADIVARLDDVAPDGSVTVVQHARPVPRVAARAARRRRTTTSDCRGTATRRRTRKPLVPGDAVEVEFEMLPMSYIFKAGHRLRLTLFFADPAAPTAPDTKARSPCFARPTTPSSVTLPIIKGSQVRGFKGSWVRR